MTTPAAEQQAHLRSSVRRGASARSATTTTTTVPATAARRAEYDAAFARGEEAGSFCHYAADVGVNGISGQRREGRAADVSLAVSVCTDRYGNPGPEAFPDPVIFVNDVLFTLPQAHELARTLTRLVDAHSPVSATRPCNGSAES
jgi:hypothetical protein